MKWEVRILSAAARDIKKLPPDEQANAVQAISSLAENPKRNGIKKLKGDAGKHNLFRLRHGYLRVVYQIINKQLIVLVVAVADRKSVYQLLKKRL